MITPSKRFGFRPARKHVRPLSDTAFKVVKKVSRSDSVFV